MAIEYQKRLIPLGRVLRKNMTPEERRLWYVFFVKLPVTVNRQKVIGRYIVDFFIAKDRLVIELDGSQHYEPAAVEADRERDLYLSELGLRVLRYTNADINQRFECVCHDILEALCL